MAKGRKLMILTSVYTCVILTLTKYYFWSLICPMFLRSQQSQQTNTYPTNLNRHDRTTKEKTNVGTRHSELYAEGVAFSGKNLANKPCEYVCTICHAQYKFKYFPSSL